MSAKAGRNEPCPCGSGKKYKKCCLSADISAERDEFLVRKEAEAKEKAKVEAERLPLVPADLKPESEPPKPRKKTKADLVWERFAALDEPDPSELKEILSEMAALPEDEEFYWTEIFDDCVKWKSIDIETAFRRISSEVRHTKRAGMGHFYWRAVEIFCSQKEKYGSLLDEVVEGFCKLDVDSYDADALTHMSSSTCLMPAALTAP